MPADNPEPASIIEGLIVKPTPANVAWGALLIWLVVASLLHGGPRGLIPIGLLAIVGFIVAVVVMLLREEARAGFLRFVFVALTLLTCFWFYFSGSYLSWKTWMWDVGSLVGFGLLGTSLTMFVFKWVEGRCKLCALALAHPHLVFPSLMLLVGWIGIAVVGHWRHTPLVRDVARFEQITPAAALAPEQAVRWQGLRVGLALSGGGYRAAVFHAGTLHALERLGIRISVLSTVSGGSIIGAYYAVGGDPQAFRDAVAQGRFNLKRELAQAHNAVRLPFPMVVPLLDVPLFRWYEFTRRDAQAGLVRDTLLGNDESWRTPDPKQPILVVNATDLNFGSQVGLMPDGAVMIFADHQRRAFHGEAWRMSETLSLADRVAISGAFPGAFPAKSIEVRAIHPPQPEEPPHIHGIFAASARPLLLADGGIFDNSGEAMLRAVDEFARKSGDSGRINPRYASDVMLVSDGGAVFGVETKLGDLAQLTRAADVMSALSAREDFSPPAIRFSAQRRFSKPAMQFQYQGGINFVRGLRGEERAARMLTSSGFDKEAQYPQAVLAEMARLLPATSPTTDLPAFRKALAASMDGRLKAFQTTSTLDDMLPQERVEDLFALGQLLVYIAWPQIEERMSAALAQRDQVPRPSK